MRKKMKEQDALKYDIKLRVNQQHYDRLNRLLSQSHYRNMSELLREIVCERQVILYTRDESLDVVMAELARIRKELNAIGINLNQVAKQVNSTTDKTKILLLGLESSELLRQVNKQMTDLFPIITQLAKKWLQE